MDYIILPMTLGILASINVLIGGLLVFKFKKYFNIILGFSGGVMLGVIFFEVLPELIHLHEELNLELELGLFFVLLGMLVFHVISFFFPLHEHGYHEEHAHHDHTNHLHKGLGVYGVSLMIVHSFIDGFGIGAGFLVSSTLGFAIALAVIMHNFSDGINTTSTLLHSNVKSSKLKFLLGLNILAPILGVVCSLYFSINEIFIFIYLGLFSGSILYLAISDILPQAHADKNKKLPIFATILGIIFVIVLTTYFHSHAH